MTNVSCVISSSWCQLQPKHDPAELCAVPWQRLWEEGGIGRFYKGFTPCLLRAVPANGIMLLTVDKVTAYLNR